jgi:membrane protein implicated in regulation of membrane protease activity
MHLSKNVQYGITAALAVYIVFFTRPAPLPLVNLLSNPLAQLAVLGAVVYIGAKVSLLVALVAAVAVVLTIPAREFFGAKKEEKKDTKKSAAEAALDIPMVSKALEKAKTAAAVPAEPEAAGGKIEAKTESKGSENFSLQDAAAF